MLRVSIAILPSECGLVLGDRDRDPDYGKRGIRTPGGFTLAGLANRYIRPLCHLSR